LSPRREITRAAATMVGDLRTAVTNFGSLLPLNGKPLPRELG
jgi:hypothetical protein